MMNQANRVNYEPHCWFLFYTLGSCLCLHTNSGGEQSREKKILTWFPFFFSFSFHIFIVWNKWGHECRIKIMKDKGWEIKSSGERESGFFWINGCLSVKCYLFFSLGLIWIWIFSNLLEDGCGDFWRKRVRFKITMTRK